MGAYIDVDGLSTYYETIGEGEPVVLLHGVGGTGGTGGTGERWTGQLDLLADWYQLFLPDRRGRGRTADITDLAAFVETLDLGPVRLVGWNDGAEAALRLALRRPDLVNRLALINGTVAWREAPPAGPDEIAALRMPLLVMQGDDDGAAIAHGAALAGTAPDGRLAVVPGTSHILPTEKPEIVNLILLDFLEDEPPRVPSDS